MLFDSMWVAGALVVLSILAVVLVLLSALAPLLPLPALRGRRAVHARLSAQVAKGTNPSLPSGERARSFVEAGREALVALKKPSLAARYARFAHELAPTDPEVVAFSIEAMRAAKRHVALERLLWLSLDRGGQAPVDPGESARHASAFSCALAGLRALYDGPLNRPERSRVLARLAAE